jgi:hypothetical protein
MKRMTAAFLCSMAFAGLAVPGAVLAAEDANVPPKGFTALFNGKDLSGWRGLAPDTNPYEVAKWTREQRAEKQKAADEDLRKHWRVEGGEIINNGGGAYLTTDKDYRDYELLVDWRMTPGTDSGIYLRGSPQVQIWDPNNKGDAEKGSGALWNNNAPEGKFPLVKADKPVGEWNRFHIVIVGNRVTVRFNDQLVVDDAVMENYWDRKRPLPATGPIELQTHGGEMRFRNVFVRELGAEEVNKRLQARDEKGYKAIFNGKDLDGWIIKTNRYTIRDGILVFGKQYGFLFTKETYSDFALRFEFKMPAGGNNGVAIRSPLEGDPAYVGMEIQMLDDPDPRYASIHDYQRHGSIYGVVAAEPGCLRPAGEWNFEEIVAVGPRVRVVLNGTPIVDADLSKIKQTADGHEHPGLHNKEGHIGFMGHDADVEFRNIRVNASPAVEPGKRP